MLMVPLLYLSSSFEDFWQPSEEKSELHSIVFEAWSLLISAASYISSLPTHPPTITDKYVDGLLELPLRYICFSLSLDYSSVLLPMLLIFRDLVL